MEDIPVFQHCAYASSITCKNWHLIKEDGLAMKEIKTTLVKHLGSVLIDALNDLGRLAVVKLTWEQAPIIDFDTVQVALKAELWPVATTDVRREHLEKMPSPPMPLRYPKDIPAVEWQCSYCNQVNEIKHMECRKCGAPRKVMR